MLRAHCQALPVVDLQPGSLEASCSPSVTVTGGLLELQLGLGGQRLGPRACMVGVTGCGSSMSIERADHLLQRCCSHVASLALRAAGHRLVMQQATDSPTVSLLAAHKSGWQEARATQLSTAARRVARMAAASAGNASPEAPGGAAGVEPPVLPGCAAAGGPGGGQQASGPCQLAACPNNPVLVPRPVTAAEVACHATVGAQRAASVGRSRCRNRVFMLANATAARAPQLPRTPAGRRPLASVCLIAASQA